MASVRDARLSSICIISGLPVIGSDPASSTQSPLQFDRLLGAGLYAQTTPPARIRVENKRLLSPVDEQFKPPHHRQFSFLFTRDGPDDENVVRTNRDARSFCFTAHRVDNRHHNTRIKLAIWVRSRRRLRPSLLFKICQHSHLLMVTQLVIRPDRRNGRAFLRPG